MAPIDTINDNLTPETLADTAIRIAQEQIGQKEQPKGSNSGPMVNEYLRAAGLQPGYAWCEAFVYWCYREAAKEKGIKNPVVKTGGVHDCWNRSADSLKLHKADALKHPENVKPGDQFILFFGANAGHTGLVEKVLWVDEADHSKGAILYTIEGNSNNNGSREGYEVVRHKRNLNDKSLQGFIQYS